MHSEALAYGAGAFALQKGVKMTVQKDLTKNIYVGNGSTKIFPFTFECPSEHPEYIKVYLTQDDGTAQATSDYLLDMSTRQITYPSSGAALPEGKKLVIMRELPLQQQMNLVNNGPYFAEDIETAFDEAIMTIQQISEKLKRTITMSVDIDGDAFVNEVPFEAGKSFRIADDGKSIVLTEDPARVLPLAQSALEAATAQAQAAAGYAKNADSCMQAAILAQQTAEQYKENAAELARAAAASEQNANEYQQAANAYKKAAAESEKAAQNYMSAAGQYWQDAQAAAASAKTSAKNAAETAAGIQDIADEVAKVHEYLNAAQLAANNAATSEANALGFLQTTKKAAAATSEMLEQATSQATNAEASAQLAQAQAQEANKFAVSAADSAEQARILLETLLANEDIVSPDFDHLNTARCGDTVAPLFEVWETADIVMASRFAEMTA